MFIAHAATTRCSKLQQNTTTTHCNTLQRTATGGIQGLRHVHDSRCNNTLQHYCNKTLQQHTATGGAQGLRHVHCSHCNNMLLHTATTHWKKNTATLCNTLQHTATGGTQGLRHVPAFSCGCWCSVGPLDRKATALSKETYTYRALY